MIRSLSSIIFICLAWQMSFSQTHDASFAPLFTGSSFVSASVLQSDNKLIIAGSFVAIGATRVSGGMVRLNADGTVDNTFNIGTGAFSQISASNSIQALTIQSNGKILVGGFFSQFNGQLANKLLRLNSDGSIDNTFNVGTGNTDNPIEALAVQIDGKILVGGHFSKFNASTAKGIVRLNSDGSFDNTFTPPAIEFLGPNYGEGVNLAIQSDGKILMGSDQTHVGGVAKPFLVRLNANGTEDVPFSTNLGTGFDNFISSVALQSDGKIIVGGGFTKVNSATANRNQVARLNTDGTLESTFNPNAGFNSGNWVEVVQVVSGDKILVGGSFTTPSNRILRLNADGTLDNTLNPGSGFKSNDGGFSKVTFIHVQSDNKIIATGQFDQYNGSVRLNVTKLSDLGTIETAYAPNPAGVATIYKTQVLSSGKILVLGDFKFLNGIPSSSIIRLLASGSPDNTFNFSGITFIAGNIRTFDVQPSDGKIVIGGDIVYASSRGLARLSPDGAYDNTFSGFTTVTQVVGSDGVYAIKATADNKLIVGGAFTSINGVSKTNFARLNLDGSLDNTFNVTGTDFVNRIVSIDTRTTDGKMILTEDTRNSDHQYAALVSLANSDGSRVNSFNINSKFDGQFLKDAIFLPDGKILIGGSFANFDSKPAQKLVKVDDAGVRDFSFKNPSGYDTYQVNDLLYSNSLSRLFLGKGQISFSSTVPVGNNYFDVMDAKGNLIEDNLQISGDVNSIVPTGTSLLLAGRIFKVGSVDVGSMVKINLPTSPTGVPSSLAITANVNQPRRITLTWADNSTDESGFEIQRSATNNSNFVLLASVPANTVTYVDQDNLQPSTTYFYRVRAINIADQTAFSNEVSGTTAVADPPTAPTSLAVTVVPPTQVFLSWSDNSSTETGFEIFRSTSNNTNYLKIATTDANVTTFSDAGLVAATNYYYKIRSIKLDDASDFSNEVNFTIPTPPSDAWSAVMTTSLPARSSGVAITINGKAYVGLGRDAGGPLKDWWEYNATNNTWTQKLDFPGTARIGAVAFVVNGKGYVGTGNDFGGTGFKRDFYEYDATSNTWTPKADFPTDLSGGAGITSGAAFAIGNFGYVGLGNTGVNNTVAFYRYNLAANVWESKANFGGTGRIGAVGFDSNGKGYFGFGYGGLSANLKDMWEYNPTTDTWLRKTDYSGAGRGGAAVATVQGDAYIFAGEEGDFSSSVRTNQNTRYQALSDSWGSLAVIPLAIRTSSMAFNIGKQVYVYGGVNSTTYYSDLVAFTPASALIPSPPGSPSTSALSETSVKTTWTDESDNETSFVLEVAQGSSSTYTIIAALPPGSVEYTANGLSSGIQYKYRVKAINSAGSSAYANMTPISTPLTAPTNLTSQALSTTSIQINWTDNSLSETGFEIYRSFSTNTNYLLISTVPANSTSFTSSGLQAGTIYFYKIRAVNATVTVSSGFSNEVSQATLVSAPSNLAIQSFTADKIAVRWLDNSSNESGFEVYRSTSNNTTYTLITTTAANANSFLDANLTEGTVYFYKIRAVNSSGASAYSNEISQATSLNPPSSLVIQSANISQIVLAWKDNSSVESGFEVYRSDATNTNYQLLSTLPANTTTFTDQNVIVDATYFYKVRAINSNGNSYFATEVSFIITGVAENSKDPIISAYPNPAMEEIAIKNNGDQSLQFTIFNSLGQPVAEVTVAAKNEEKIPCAKWSTGVYILKTFTTDQQPIRIVKK